MTVIDHTGISFNFSGFNPVVLSGDGEDQLYHIETLSFPTFDPLPLPQETLLTPADAGVVVDDSAHVAPVNVAGTSADDILLGGDGNDTLAGGDGNNYVDGGSGETMNTISATGTGYNILLGGAGHDSVSGGEGNDILNGYDGPDTLYGNGGDDTIYGGFGDDFRAWRHGQRLHRRWCRQRW